MPLSLGKIAPYPGGKELAGIEVRDTLQVMPYALSEPLIHLNGYYVWHSDH